MRKDKSGRGTAADKDEATGRLSVAWVQECYKKGCDSIRAEVQDYWLNHAFLQNRQWLFWNTASNQLDETLRDPDRVQVTINRLLPASRSIISKAVSREMRFDVSPTEADDATIRAAHLSEAVLRDTHREHDWEGLREDHLWTMWRGGTGAICVDWDASAGQQVGETDAGKRVGTGDTVETVLSIAEFVTEPGARNAERARWWIRSQALPPKDVQAAYGLDAEPAADAMAGASPHQRRLAAASSGTQGGSPPNMTLVLTYYERPNPLRPDGAIGTVVGDQFVDGPRPWYFPWKDRLNLAVGRETRVDARWTGETVLSAARPVQTAFNLAYSAVLEHMKLAGNARLLVPQTGVDLILQMTDEPGELMPYQEGSEPPKWLSPPQLPAWVIEQPGKLAKELDDILSYHPVSRGEAPANIESGYGLSILSENDATPLGRLVKETALVWGRVARMVLDLFAVKATESRTAKVLVPGQAPETATWTGKSLMGQTNAEVPSDAVLPRSRAALQAFAEKAMSMGLVQNFAQFARVAELPGQEDLINAVSPDVGKARRENHIMATGGIAVPAAWDDDKVHIQELNDFRKSARFAMLSPDIQDVFAIHAQAHETQAAEQMGAQVARGAISPALAAVPNTDGAPGLSLPDAGAAMPMPTAGDGPAGLPFDLPPIPASL